MGKVLFFDAGKTLLNLAFMGGSLGLLTEMFDGAGKEATSAASGVENTFAQAWIDLFDDELSDGARGIKFACITRRLKVFK